jgi:hypothetical protein
MALDLSTYSKEELQGVLRILRGYRNARKQIGTRARIVDTRVIPEKLLVVELPNDKKSDDVQSLLEAVVAKFFSEARGKSPVFRTNHHLKGGIRMFYGDDMVDVSFERFATLIQSFSNL